MLQLGEPADVPAHPRAVHPGPCARACSTVAAPPPGPQSTARVGRWRACWRRHAAARARRARWTGAGGWQWRWISPRRVSRCAPRCAAVWRDVMKGALLPCLPAAAVRLAALHTPPPSTRLAFPPSSRPQGMLYLHGHKPPIIHRDLKPAHCLVCADWQLRVAEFPLGRGAEPPPAAAPAAAAAGLRADPRWQAPEVRLQPRRARRAGPATAIAARAWLAGCRRGCWVRLVTVRLRLRVAAAPCPARSSSRSTTPRPRTSTPLGSSSGSC